MTVREKLAKVYPLHFQRILEATYAWYGDYADRVLYDSARKICLVWLFPWDSTEEGFSYWDDLSRAEH